MSKLIFVHGEDERLVDLLVQTLRDNGYALEHADAAKTDGFDRIRADVAFVCRAGEPPHRLTLGDFTLDLDGVCAYDRKGNHIHFTPTEFAMLSYLMKNAHRAVPRAELLPAVWGFENTGGTRVADDTAKRIRRKLNGCGIVLETVWNYGFRVRIL